MTRDPLLPSPHPRRRLHPAGGTTAAAALVLAAAATIASGTALAQDGDTMMGDGTEAAIRRVVHDPVYFEERVLPLLERECIGCHDRLDPANQSNHRLTASDAEGHFTPEAVRANYETITALLSPTAPERSRVLLKVLPLPQGGIDHDGGKADGESFARSLTDPKGPLVQWIFGATKTAAAPVAVAERPPRTVDVGDDVVLDGRMSFDPDDDPLTLRWEVVEAPLGATARPADAAAVRTQITPDRPGPWTLRLRASDGKLSGLPVIVRFAALATAGPGAMGTGGGDLPGPVADIPSADRRRTRALYLDLQGRTPVEEELRRICALPWEERVDRLLAEDATWLNWFDEEAFYFLLIDRFRPVSDRLADIPARMARGEATYHDAHLEFALSAEFNARNPGNDTYVTVVLEQFLGIEVQSEAKLLKAAKKMYDGSLDRIFGERGESQSDVVQISLRQQAYVDLFTRRMEERYLGARLPEKEHELAALRLETDPAGLRDLLREWILSERYRGTGDSPRGARHKTDHQFIRSLYVDLMGRPPAYAEFRNMRNALQAMSDPGPLRGVLAKVMLDSGDVLPPGHADAAPTGRRVTSPTQPEGAGKGNGKADGDSGSSPEPPPIGRDGSPDPRRRGPVTGIPNPTNPAAGAGNPREVRALVAELFDRFLGRDPEPAELDAFETEIRDHGASWRTCVLALITSPHYQYY